MNDPGYEREQSPALSDPWHDLEFEAATVGTRNVKDLGFRTEGLNPGP